MSSQDTLYGNPVAIMLEAKAISLLNGVNLDSTKDRDVNAPKEIWVILRHKIPTTGRFQALPTYSRDFPASHSNYY